MLACRPLLSPVLSLQYCYSVPVGVRSIVITHLSVSVCVSVREHISVDWNRSTIGTKFLGHIPCGRGSILFRWRCAMLCTSGFMDDVTFGRNGREGWRGSVALGAGDQLRARPGRSLISMNACFNMFTLSQWMTGRVIYHVLEECIIIICTLLLLLIVLYTRLGFKTRLSKTKTKTETQDLQDQYWKSMTGMNCDKQKVMANRKSSIPVVAHSKQKTSYYV